MAFHEEIQKNLEQAGEFVGDFITGGQLSREEAAEDRQEAKKRQRQQAEIRNQRARTEAVEKAIQQRAQLRAQEAISGVQSSAATGAQSELTSDITARLGEQATLAGLEESRINALERAQEDKIKAGRFRAARDTGIKIASAFL